MSDDLKLTLATMQAELSHELVRRLDHMNKQRIIKMLRQRAAIGWGAATGREQSDLKDALGEQASRIESIQEAARREDHAENFGFLKYATTPEGSDRPAEAFVALIGDLFTPTTKGE